MILTVLLSAAAAGGQPAEAKTSGLSFSIDTYRPLAALADELEQRYQIVVTYEEGPWVSLSDLESKPGPSRPIPIPRKAAVSFEYAAPADGQSVGVADLLSAFLVQYHNADAPGRFRVEGSNGFYHLIPSELKDAEGHWQAASPVFDIPVHLADEERTVDDTLDDTLDEIVAQLNESSPVVVGWGFVPLNLLNQTRIQMAADGVPAREVIRRILSQVPRRTTWRLNYDPLMKRYILSFLIRPNASNVSVPAR